MTFLASSGQILEFVDSDIGVGVMRSVSISRERIVVVSGCLA